MNEELTFEEDVFLPDAEEEFPEDGNEELDAADLEALAESVASGDSLRQYLREIGKTPLFLRPLYGSNQEVTQLLQRSHEA